MKTLVMNRRFLCYIAKAVFALNDFSLSTYISTPSEKNHPICISLTQPPAGNKLRFVPKDLGSCQQAQTKVDTKSFFVLELESCILRFRDTLRLVII